MAEEINKGWLKDVDGNKFAPKTLMSLVQDENGKGIGDRFDKMVYGGEALKEGVVDVKYITENDYSSTVVDNILYEKIGNMVFARAIGWVTTGVHSIPDGYKPKYKNTVSYIPCAILSDSYINQTYIILNTNGTLNNRMSVPIIFSTSWVAE